MKAISAILVGAAVLYAIDSAYLGGRYFHALIQIMRLACASVGFYW